MKWRNWIGFVMMISLFFLDSSCNEKEKSKKNKDKDKDETEVKATPLQQTDYDLLHPVHRWALTDSLTEISGIVFQKNGNILAIEDMHPILYELKLGDTSAMVVNKMEFRKSSEEKFDFEDLAIANDTVYALWSHGAIFKIIEKNKNITSQRTKTWLKKDNNTEGLTYDPVSGNLLVACKDESGLEDAKKSTRAIFEFDIKGDSLKTEPFMLINKKDFENIAGEKIDFNPAAIAVHPVSHDVFVISTKDTKCIAQFSHDGKLKAFDYFEKDMLPQPEGICFDSKGNLFVSTEARHGKPPFIYEFAIKK